MKRGILLLPIILLVGCASIAPQQIQARKDAFFVANPNLPQEIKKNIQEGSVTVGND